MAKKCNMCGADIDENVSFCPYCGVKVESQVQPEVVIQNQQPTPTKPKKTGTFVGAIVCLGLTIFFGLIYLFQYMEIISTGAEDESIRAIFVLYILLAGWFSLFPAIITTIVTIVCSSLTLKSSSKAFKVICIITLVLGIIIAIALMASLLLPSVMWS